MDSDTDADAAPDTDDPDLRARVAELEASVAQQQETITKMLPGRRGVLKAGALLGGGALVGAGTADRASAQASGQVGTSNDPVDVEAHDLAVQNQLSSNVDAGGNDLTNVGSVNTDEIATSRTWQEVTASRQLDTQFTNDTDGEIQAVIILNVTGGNTSIGFKFTVDGVPVDRWDANNSVTFDTGDNFSTQAINIPAGSTYSTLAFRDSGSFELKKWIEFRP